MLKLARYLKLFKFEVIFGPIFKLTEAIFEIIVPLVMAAIIDKGVVGGGGRDYILKMGGVLVLLGVLGLGFSLSCQFLASKASQGVGTAMRNDLFRHIQSFSHRELDKFGTDSLTTRVTNDVNQLQLAVAMLIRLAVRVPCLIIGSAVMAISINKELSIVFFIACPLVALVLWLVMSRTVPLYSKIQKKLDRVSLIARENLAGARVVRAFSNGAYEKKRFSSAAEDLTGGAVRAGRISALLSPATFLIMNTAVIAILYRGGFKVDAGTLTQGEVIALINYIGQILLAMVVLANLVIIFTRAAACAGRVNEVFETKPSVGGEEEFLCDKNAPAVEFSGVSFAYGSGEETALENISFTLNQGETMGIIGGTGSGKTTLVSLIPGFYNPTRGTVRVCGQDVKNLNKQELRRSVAFAEQNAAIIAGTIGENIRMGRDWIKQSDIEKAAATAQADIFINEKEEGYNSSVRRGGSNLSGGQKQRISIARALAGKPGIIILDDSSSALDFATDAALRRALKEDTEGAAVIIVSQRVSSVRSADKIAVMDDGEIVGIGTHEELLKNCPVYGEICASQLREGAAK